MASFHCSSLKLANLTLHETKTAGGRFFSRNQAGVWGETLQITNHSRSYCLPF